MEYGGHRVRKLIQHTGKHKFTLAVREDINRFFAQWQQRKKNALSPAEFKISVEVTIFASLSLHLSTQKLHWIHGYHPNKRIRAKP